MFFAVMRAELERTAFEMFEVRWCWSVLSVKHHAVCCELVVLVVLALAVRDNVKGKMVKKEGRGGKIFLVQSSKKLNMLDR